MATTRREAAAGKAGKGGKKAKQKRMLLALGLVALAVIGYLWYRSRSSTSLAASPSGANAGSGTGDQTGSAGGISGSPLDQQGSDLLSTLAAENQSLIGSLLAGRVGGTVGGVTNSQPVAEQTPSVQAAAPAPSGVSASDFQVAGGAIPVTGVSAPVQGFDQYPVLDLSNVQAPAAPSYDSIQAAPVPVVKPPAPGTINPTLDLSGVGSSAPSAPSKPPVSSASGAAAVKSGAAKVNYQAKARAA